MNSTSNLNLASPAAQRKPRLLWASAYCLLDTTSGAAMAVHEMLRQLVRNGYEVSVLGATVFDHERGTAGLKGGWPEVHGARGKWVTVQDGVLTHRLYVTAHTQREQMTCGEETVWFEHYRKTLERYKPDVVFYYGGKPLDMLLAAEARACGVAVVFYLANGNYGQKRWSRDVDLVLTDSQATATHYERLLGLRPVPVGAFIDPERVVAPQRQPQRLLFINPTLHKGAALVVQLALLLEKRRPDVLLEVVESRGQWDQVLHAVSASLGQPRTALSNVVVTPHTNDMRPIYGRARLLLAPSLWWESSGRVLVEAMLNGIPAIITDNGGMPEMVQDSGVVLKLSPIFHEKPYEKLPPNEALEPLLRKIEALFDDEVQYSALSQRALQVGQQRHGLQVSTRRLLEALQPLVSAHLSSTGKQST